MLTGTGFGADVGVGLMFLIVTALITFIITPGVTAIRKNKTPA